MKLSFGEVATVGILCGIAYAVGYFFGYDNGEERGTANTHMMWLEVLCEQNNTTLDDLINSHANR